MIDLRGGRWIGKTHFLCAATVRYLAEYPDRKVRICAINPELFKGIVFKMAEQAGMSLDAVCTDKYIEFEMHEEEEL